MYNVIIIYTDALFKIEIKVNHFYEKTTNKNEINHLLWLVKTLEET